MDFSHQSWDMYIFDSLPIKRKTNSYFSGSKGYSFMVKQTVHQDFDEVGYYKGDNSINPYKMAKYQPIAGRSIPYTVIKVAVSWVSIMAKNNGKAGFTDQKGPLVLATNTIRWPATDSFRYMKDCNTSCWGEIYPPQCRGSGRRKELPQNPVWWLHLKSSSYPIFWLLWVYHVVIGNGHDGASFKRAKSTIIKAVTG